MRYLITGASGFIGTNLVDALSAGKNPLLNLDVAPPLDTSHGSFWSECDILHRERLVQKFQDFAPECVIHLAARTDCDERTTVEEGYATNTTGTANVLEAVKATPSVKRLIITSSQYVCGPEHTPRNDEDFAPHTVYGESKARSERITRDAELDCVWTIVRPTNIWGPWHMRYKREFWRIVRKGLYVHPGGAPVVRSYGYVGNVVWQMLRIVDASAEHVHKKVLYLGDPPGDIYEWTNAFSKTLTGHRAKKVPRAILFSLSLAGSCIQAVGIKSPLTLSRYRSMTTDYPSSIQNTDSLLGKPPFSLQQGVDKTVEWLRIHDDNENLSPND